MADNQGTCISVDCSGRRFNREGDISKNDERNTYFMVRDIVQREIDKYLEEMHFCILGKGTWRELNGLKTDGYSMPKCQHASTALL